MYNKFDKLDPLDIYKHNYSIINSTVCIIRNLIAHGMNHTGLVNYILVTSEAHMHCVGHNYNLAFALSLNFKKSANSEEKQD